MVASACLAQPRVQLAIDQSIFVSDNPFLLPGSNTGSMALQIAASPRLELQPGYATSLVVEGTGRVRRYQRRYGDFVTGRTDATVRHRKSEYLSLRGALGYARELPTDSLTGSLDAALETTSVREIQSARLLAEWSPDAVTMVNAGLGAMHTRYPGSRLLQATRSQDIAVDFSRRLSTRTTVGVQGQVSVSKGSGLGSRTAKTLQLTTSRKFSRAWRTEIRAGVEWAGTQRLLGGGSGGQQPRFTGSGTLCKESARLTLCLEGALRSEVSALTGLRRELTLSSNADLRLSEYGTLMFAGDYRKASGGAIPISLFRASVVYDHKLSQRFSLKGGVDYVRRRVADSEPIGAAIGYVSLTFRGFRE